MTNLKDDVRVFVDVVESKVCEGIGVEGCVVLTQGCKDGDPVGSLWDSVECDGVQCDSVMVVGEVNSIRKCWRGREKGNMSNLHNHRYQLNLEHYCFLEHV